ncbi:Pro-resilin [Portunus trituberculatus]|uniref:Pro-resilin n=1 Tax=Portunus trituberculatus TaxID=210409 RepID=A0A5B7FX59_PORTR|nr:Pro-resilin [Portunus trituberculatus]
MDSATVRPQHLEHHVLPQGTAFHLRGDSILSYHAARDAHHSDSPLFSPFTRLSPPSLSWQPPSPSRSTPPTHHIMLLPNHSHSLHITHQPMVHPNHPPTLPVPQHPPMPHPLNQPMPQPQYPPMPQPQDPPMPHPQNPAMAHPSHPPTLPPPTYTPRPPTLTYTPPQPHSYAPSPKYGNPEPPKKPVYNFEWAVKDDYAGLHFGQNEKRDGYNTDGTYHVLLPDGRVQKVEYKVEKGSGYIATVEYETKHDHKGYGKHTTTYAPYTPRAYTPSTYGPSTRPPYVPSTYAPPPPPGYAPPPKGSHHH